MKGIKDDKRRIKLSIKYWEEQQEKLLNRLRIIHDHLIVLDNKMQRYNEHYDKPKLSKKQRQMIDESIGDHLVKIIDGLTLRKTKTKKKRREEDETKNI